VKERGFAERAARRSPQSNQGTKMSVTNSQMRARDYKYCILGHNPPSSSSSPTNHQPHLPHPQSKNKRITNSINIHTRSYHKTSLTHNVLRHLQNLLRVRPQPDRIVFSGCRRARSTKMQRQLKVLPSRGGRERQDGGREVLRALVAGTEEAGR
jgi:hypothetical protein